MHGLSTATGIVPAGSSVTASAGNAVVLNPGFDSRPTFVAEIGSCKTAGNKTQSIPMDSSQLNIKEQEMGKAQK